jgi:hypothetical protein
VGLRSRKPHTSEAVRAFFAIRGKPSIVVERTVAPLRLFRIRRFCDDETDEGNA